MQRHHPIQIFYLSDEKGSWLLHKYVLMHSNSLFLILESSYFAEPLFLGWCSYLPVYLFKNQSLSEFCSLLEKLKFNLILFLFDSLKKIVKCRNSNSINDSYFVFSYLHGQDVFSQLHKFGEKLFANNGHTAHSTSVLIYSS